MRLHQDQDRRKVNDRRKSQKASLSVETLEGRSLLSMTGMSGMGPMSDPTPVIMSPPPMGMPMTPPPVAVSSTNAMGVSSQMSMTSANNMEATPITPMPTSPTSTSHLTSASHGSNSVSRNNVGIQADADASERGSMEARNLRMTASTSMSNVFAASKTTTPAAALTPPPAASPVSIRAMVGHHGTVHHGRAGGGHHGHRKG